MYKNIIGKYHGKTFNITYYADGSTAWFVYGIGQQMLVVQDFWSFVLLDQITDIIDAHIAEQEYAS